MIKNKRIKRWGFLISLFVLFVIAPFRVQALQTLTVSGDDSISPGAVVKYDIELNSNDITTITEFSTDVYYESSVFTLTNVESGIDSETGIKIWECGEVSSLVSGGTLTCKTVSETGYVGDSVVATLVFKVNTTAAANYSYINLKNAKFKYVDYLDNSSSSTQLEEITKDLSVKSNDATLKDLKIDGVSIEGFASDIYEYDVISDPMLDIIKVEAVTNSGKANFKSGLGSREVVLNYGSNVIIITVVSESGNEQSYSLNVTREDTRSTDTTLKSLTVDGVSIKNFKSNVYKYNLIEYKLSTLDIVGVPNDEKASVTVTPPQTIVEGDNTFIITVTSENGNTANYTLIVRNVVESISKKLKNLSVIGYDIGFDKNMQKYTISYNKTKFKDLQIIFSTVSNSDLVKAELLPNINEDIEARNKLKPGDEITVRITGIDGETVEYKIEIMEDTRVSFYLVLEVFLMIVIVIVILLVANYRKNGGKSKKKTTNKTVVKKDDKSNVSSNVNANKNTTKPKKKKFSIFEEEDEEEDLESTKELSKEELNLK